MSNLPAGTIGPVEPVAPVEPSTPVFFEVPLSDPIAPFVTGNQRLVQEAAKQRSAN